ncbi:MAG TPA: hypothetical protein VL486_14930 [Verrucomicrobiae bacterium]|nr:hypothetical protein [Verrucomicrobiae bacterium]
MSTGWRSYTQLRNTVSRATNTTGDAGSLFPKEEWISDNCTDHLTVYVRFEPQFKGMFWELIEKLAQSGFGADISAGKGQFRLHSTLQSAADLDQPADAPHSVVLSTFQPSAQNPTQGYWESFTKYGKLGPDFGLDNVFKRPLIMLRPGACFRGNPPCRWLGRAVPMTELLSREVAEALTRRRVDIAHLAFGLAVPAKLNLEEGYG